MTARPVHTVCILARDPNPSLRSIAARMLACGGGGGTWDEIRVLREGKVIRSSLAYFAKKDQDLSGVSTADLARWAG